MRRLAFLPTTRARSLRARHLLTALAGATAIVSAPFLARSEQLSGPAILHELRCFREMGSVLYVAAHPDDENTMLITYLARGRNYRTAYLSLTRGDGGQNVLGPEFGEQLGVIRTQELLAARRLDGGQQFFTRAIDFGFSKDYRETLRIWDHQEVVSDIVRVIRTFRPDVIITRFSTKPGGTHGHHTASAVLALEAFKLAGDPAAFPEQLPKLAPWQPKRILMNGRGGGDDSLKIEVNDKDSVTGESFATIAGRSRAMHKTQGFGNFGGAGGGARSESFQLLAGEPASKDILDGVDTTWGRIPNGAEIGKLADEIIAQFDPQKPVASVPAVLKLRNLLSHLPGDPIVDEKRGQLDHILQACLGLEVETSIPQAEVVPGEMLKLQHRATVSSSVPVRWVGVRYPSIKKELTKPLDLQPNQPALRDSGQALPASTPFSQPYWLREEPGIGMYRVADASLIGRPENPPAFPIEQIFEVEGQTLDIPDEPLQAESHRRLDVIPPVALKFDSDVKLFTPGSSREVKVEVSAFRDNPEGTLKLDAPVGWTITPATETLRYMQVGAKQGFTFTVTAPTVSSTASIGARAQIGGAVYSLERVELNYKHVPFQLLQPPARIKAVNFELATRGKNIGYVPGAGDSVAEGLEQMGYHVSRLTGGELTTNRLKDLDAVVIGIRAFNVRTDLVAQLPALFAFVEAGGNVIVQYNRPGGDLKTEQLAPYSLKLSQERVTDEDSPVSFLATNHPALNTPNKITDADFKGWVQERGVYFPNEWDDHFTPILACNDPGEAPKTGSLLIAPYGKGYFVYTGLAFFRQLPAGVPGAYRLFANLVSLGK
jgi:LmbE family N-acetylglucosaminyl deacetylase